MGIEEKYLDILQNLEFSIIQIYRSHDDMLDYDALAAVEAVIDFYKAKQSGREMREFKLSENSRLAFASLKEVCEFRLNKENFPNPVAENELINCLKKIQNSINKWTKRSGRKGYLDFVKDYLP